MSTKFSPRLGSSPHPGLRSLRSLDLDCSGYLAREKLALAAKRADNFLAGTKVVWDVDPEANEVRAYRADSQNQPVVFTTGQDADAEPAVPGWRIAVSWLMA